MGILCGPTCTGTTTVSSTFLCPSTYNLFITPLLSPGKRTWSKVLYVLKKDGLEPQQPFWPMKTEIDTDNERHVREELGVLITPPQNCHISPGVHFQNFMEKRIKRLSFKPLLFGMFCSIFAVNLQRVNFSKSLKHQRFREKYLNTFGNKAFLWLPSTSIAISQTHTFLNC